MHFPYKMWVPDYTTPGAPYYGPSTTGYYSELQTSINGGTDERAPVAGSYNYNIMTASISPSGNQIGSRFARTLQLMSIGLFDKQNAIVSTSVSRSGKYSSCVASEAIPWGGPPPGMDAGTDSGSDAGMDAGTAGMDAGGAVGLGVRASVNH